MPIRAYFDTWDANSEAEMLAIRGHKGDTCRRLDIGKTYILRNVDASKLSSWAEILTTTDSNYGTF